MKMIFVVIIQSIVYLIFMSLCIIPGNYGFHIYSSCRSSKSSKMLTKTSLLLSSSTSSIPTSTSSPKKILCVGANAMVGGMVVKLLNDNGYDTSTLTIPDDLSKVDNLLQTVHFDLVILGGAVPKYPEYHAQLLNSLAKYASTSIIHQVISPTPPPGGGGGSMSTSPTSATTPLPLEVTGQRIAEANLKTANNYFVK